MNNQNPAMDIINRITTESPEDKERRRILAEQMREDEALIRKLENNDIYADKERDMDIGEEPESKGVFCPYKPVRDIELL